MPLGTIWELWQSFFFRQESAVPIAVFRIGFGVCLLIEAALTAVDLDRVYGERGVLPHSLWRQARDAPGTGFVPRGRIYWACFRFGAFYRLFFALHVLAVIALTVGWRTRGSALVSWVTLRLLQERNVFAIGGYEASYRLLLFLLIFAPSGSALSVDAWLATHSLVPNIRVDAWAIQLVRLQVCWFIVDTAWHKLHGKGWTSGEAIFRLMEFARQRPELARGLTGVVLPEGMCRPWVYRLMSRGTLAVQLVCPFGLWIDEWRAASLALLVVHHIGIQIMMNVGLYQPMMIVGLSLFWNWGRA